jgi:ribosomal protein L44E
MPKYNVTVVRSCSASRVIEVEADNEQEAKEQAACDAGNYDFSEKEADYVVDDVELIPELEVIHPDCEVNRLAAACPGRDISHSVFCPYCDPNGDHIVCIDAEEPRKNLMRNSFHTNKEGKNVFRFEAHDWNEEDDELSGHVVFTCTDCGKKIVSQFEYTYPDDEWEEIKRERQEEEDADSN